MQLMLHSAGGPRVRKVENDKIWVDASALSASFYIAGDTLVQDIGVVAGDTLPDTLIDTLLALRPEVVLLGSGPRQRFQPAVVQARFLRAGIGFEVMDNGAAARTFSVLQTEARAVVALFLLP